jgi:hypothetical protein
MGSDVGLAECFVLLGRMASSRDSLVVFSRTADTSEDVNESSIASVNRNYNAQPMRTRLKLHRFRKVLGIALLLIIAACHQQSSGFVMLRVDRTVSPISAYPVAIDPSKVGTYSPDTKSGAGYFYDDVLEYRVWLNPDNGAAPLNGEKDYFAAFAQYERAEAFSKSTAGAEIPIVLVRQREWIDESTPGQFHDEKTERVTEWRVKWLAGNKRGADTIKNFLAHPKPAPKEEE